MTHLEPADDLLQRFFGFARPIADAYREPGLNMRLTDPAVFDAFVADLERAGQQGIEETLLLFLDEFCQLEQRSFDELYLWSLLYLSRLRPEHAETFWPLALTLDLRFRADPWRRPADATVVDQPYRLTELVLYGYVQATQPPEPELMLIEVYLDEPVEEPPAPSPYLSLATLLKRIFPRLEEAQVRLLQETLAELSRQDGRPAFGDAHGLLLKLRRERREGRADVQG